MMERLLPRHVQIIGEINRRWMEALLKKWPDGPRVWGLSIFEEGERKKIRMGNLAIVGANKINGVAAIHTEIVKKETFADYYQWCQENGMPNKFVNMTNGVTPRRWIHLANRPLSDIFTKYLGTHKWLINMEMLKGLTNKQNDPQLQLEWTEMKMNAKARLAKYLKETINFEVDPEMLFDCQFKRIHEYK